MYLRVISLWYNGYGVLQKLDIIWCVDRSWHHVSRIEPDKYLKVTYETNLLKKDERWNCETSWKGHSIEEI